MCFNVIRMLLLLMMVAASCTSYRKIHKIKSGDVNLELSVAGDAPLDDETDPIIDSICGTFSDGPLIMNAIRDDETGEMVATDVIRASRVVARFRNVAERAGYVTIGFDVIVPEQLCDSKWQLRINPSITLMDEMQPLDAVFITGNKYRAAQLRGYERYRRFLSSIVNDTTEFIRIQQLEIFLMRYYPDTYAMKTDSSYVSDPMAENLFGVTQVEALRHYTDHFRQKKNESRRARSDKMFARYVRDPIKKEGVKLDTVLCLEGGAFAYRYLHTFKSRPGLKKAVISIDGGLYEEGESVVSLNFPEDITFYISSLSSLADESPKYRSLILERRVFDNTKALIDFAQGSSVVDTTLGDNASELARILRCIDDVSARTEYALDSLVIVASCSPEGAYELNRSLSLQRSKAVRDYISQYVSQSWRDSLKVSELPENWEQLAKLVSNDKVISDEERSQIMEIISISEYDPDKAEARMASHTQYRYLREKIYPKLRSVRFDFHMHRIGMQKDTLHTSELDTLYMSGVEALKNLDYKRAVSILRPYDDYNSALAYVSADYNHSALDVLSRLDDSNPKVSYLKSMVLSRLNNMDEAVKYYRLCLECDSAFQFRANLDPEMFRVVNEYKSTNLNENEF